MNPATTRPASLRRAALVLDAFVAVTAIGGGIALATGAEAARFPDEWLDRTPWTSYLVPGVILACVVGGSALVATVAVARRTPFGGPATVVAALVLAAQIGGELTLLAQPGGPTPAELLYLTIAAGMLGCGLLLHRTGDGRPADRSR
jgi:hypothetical protein